MRRYIISETRSGNFIVELYDPVGIPIMLVENKEDIRNTGTCLERIHKYVTHEWMAGEYENYQVELVFASDRLNAYTAGYPANS